MIDRLTEQRFVISVLTIVIAALFDFFVTFHQPSLDKELLTVLLTTLNANGLVVVVSYWLGSSKGSADKSMVIQDIAGNKAP